MMACTSIVVVIVVCFLRIFIDDVGCHWLANVCVRSHLFRRQCYLRRVQVVRSTAQNSCCLAGVSSENFHCSRLMVYISRLLGFRADIESRFRLKSGMYNTSVIRMTFPSIFASMLTSSLL